MSLDDARSRLPGSIDDFTTEFAGITRATGHMVRRKGQAAVEGREPTFDSRQNKNELMR